MKAIFEKILFVIGLSLSLVLIFILWRPTQEPQRNPLPSEHQEEEQQHLQREQWIETLHRTAPGVDWRAMDRSYREAQYQLKLPEVQRIRKNGRIKGAQIDTIANGILTGTWVEKGSKNMAGRMHCVDVDFANNLLYAASSGGQIWKGSMKGENWTSLTDHKQVKNVIFLRVFPNAQGNTRIMMNTRAVLFYYSDDMGVTWQLGAGLSSFRSGGGIVRTVSKPDGTIYMLVNKSGYNFLMRSTDLGENFERVARISGTNYSDIWSGRFSDGGDLYYVDKNEFYRFNGGDAFEKIHDISLNFSTNEIQKIQMKGCHNDTTDFIYVMYSLEKSSYFFGSDDSGNNWSYRGANTERAFMPNSFGVSHLNPKLLAFGGVNAFTSRDGGLSWQAINSWGDYYGDRKGKLHADIPEIEFFVKPDGKEIAYVCTDGGTFYSDNDLLGVENVSLSGLQVSQYYSSYTHREMTQVIYAGAQDQGFQRTNQDGEGVVEFTQTISGDYGHIVSGDGGNSFWTVYPGFAMRYPDAVAGTQIVTWDFAGKNHLWMPPLMEDPYNPAVVYLAGGTSTSGSHMWRLEDKGGSISPIELPFDFSDGNDNHWISAMAYSPINKDYRYVLNTGGKIFYSTDRGIDWQKSGSLGPGSHYFYGNTIVPSPNDINTIYIGGAGYSAYPVYVSTNGGATFTPMWDGLPRTLVFEMKIDETGSLLFAATEVGPYVCNLKEKKWYDLGGTSVPQQTYWGVDYIPMIKTARFATYGRGIWDFTIQSFDGGSTGIDETIISSASGLVTVYPNPFVDKLTIRPLNQDQTVHIQIYSLTGSLVYQSEKEPGSSTMEWKPKGLPAGLYLISVRQGILEETVRVIKQ